VITRSFSAEMPPVVCRPSGTRSRFHVIPALKRWAKLAPPPRGSLGREVTFGAHVKDSFVALAGLSASSLAVTVLLFVFLVAPAPAEVLKIVVHDTIHPITDEYIGRAISEAARSHDQALLIELSTPGGLVDSTRDIIEKLSSAPVPVIIYVTPSGSRAASAGFFILEAADVAAMAPGTNTGAAHPVIFGSKMDDVMKQKLENDAAALMRSVASKRGRNVQVAESAVRESKSFTEQEALSQKLIDYVASSEDDLFRQMQGKSFKRFDGQTVTLNLVGQPVRNYDMTLKQQILSYLLDPNVAFILLAIGALALYVEFNHPGAVLPGTVGAIFILLALFALNLLPTRYAAVALILASFALFALEAKLASHGVLGVGGIVTLTLGALLLVDGPIPEMRVRLVTALAVSIPLGVITVFLMSIALKARAGKVVTGEQGLIGEIGMAQTALTPRGKVFVHGEIWDAVAPADIAAGERVIVRRITDLQLEVEALTGTQSSQTVSLLTRT
jgi:membrane-bound serine protease (ClpP class)